MLFRRFALAALAATLAPALVACGGGSEAVKVGDVIPARHDDQFTSGRASRVLVPTGRLTVHLGKPVDTVAAKKTQQLEEITAPDGSVFVPLTWNFDGRYFKSLLPYVDSESVPVIDLIIGKNDYRLPTPTEGPDAQSFYVAVDGDPDTVAERAVLSVEFDGVTQRADLHSGNLKKGRAEALYRISRKRAARTDCSDGWRTGPVGVADFSCRIAGPTRLPYAAGKWAPKGRQFSAMALSTSLRKYGIAGSATAIGAYAAQTVATDVALAGKKPVAQITVRNETNQCPSPGTSDCNFATYLVFPASAAGSPAGQLRIAQTYGLVLGMKYGGYRGKQRVSLTAGTTISLPGGH